MDRCTEYLPRNSPAGHTGPDAAPRTNPVPVGKHGSPGACKSYVGHDITMAAQLSVSFVSMMLNDASLRYINLDVDGAAQRLIWLRNLLYSIVHFDEYQAASPKAVADEIDSAIPKVKALQTAPEMKLYVAFLTRVQVLLEQISKGVDYYGEAYNYVPLLSERYFEFELNSLIQTASLIEDYAIKYRNAGQNQAIAADQINQAKAKSAQLIIDKTAERQQLVEIEEPLLEAAIQQLEVQRDALWVHLLAADQAFLEALRQKAGACPIENVLAAVSAVSTVFEMVSPAGAALSVGMTVLRGAPLLDESNKPIPDNFGGFKKRVQIVRQAGSTVSSFANAVTALGGLLTPKKDDSGRFVLPSDEAKILASADDFEKALADFKDVPGSDELKEALDAFVSVCEARNNKIIEYNQTQTRVDALEADIQQLQAEIDRLQTQLAANANPFIYEASAFMDRAWIESKTRLIRRIYQLDRAHRYYALTNAAPLVFDDFSVVALAATRQDLLNRYTVEKASVTSRRGTLDTQPIDLMAYLPKSGGKVLNDKGEATFTLPLNAPGISNLCRLLISEIEIIARDSRGPIPSYSVQITHHGRALQRDEQGKTFSFSHLPINVPFVRDRSKVTVHGNCSSDDYAGLTPYGPWTFKFDKLPNGSFPNINGLSIVLKGTASKLS